jgi:putative Holliday junction resolvase
MRMLGVDFGTKRIGLALSDESGRFAFPHSVIENNSRAVAVVVGICKKEDISKIVMGESLNFKGEKNAVMTEIEKFVESLRGEVRIPIEFQNEVLTSREASRVQGDNDMNDASAAALILKHYIDKSGQGTV